jgi:hypothetical protein
MIYLLGLIAVIAFVVIIELIKPPRWAVAALGLFLALIGPIIMIAFHWSFSFPRDLVPIGFMALVILVLTLLPRARAR